MTDFKDTLLALVAENMELRKQVQLPEPDEDDDRAYWRERAWKWQYMFELIATSQGFDLDRLTNYSHSDEQKPDENPTKTHKDAVKAVKKARKTKPHTQAMEELAAEQATTRSSAARPTMIPNKLTPPTSVSGTDVMSLMRKIQAG